MTSTAAKSRPKSSEKYRRNRELILNAASDQINRHGLHGLTFRDVATAVGMNTSSITYYFRHKELLACATFEEGMERWRGLVAKAAEAETPRDRVRALLHEYLVLFARIRAGEEPQLTLLSDLRSLDDDNRNRLIGKYQKLIWEVAMMFGQADGTTGRARNLARAQILLDVLYWSRTWLPLYADEDLPRVERRLMEYLDHGFATPEARWSPRLLPTSEGDGGASDMGNDTVNRETYLRAATLLINQRGYRGASVERIAAFLSVSKGSFYHHLNGKDQLVQACFEHSFSRISAAQFAAIDGPGDGWQKLTGTIEALLSVQFDARFPMMRTTALQALPEQMRPDILARSRLLARRFAGMMADAISEGTIRSIDPMIVSHCLMCGTNAAYDFQFWSSRKIDKQTALRIYARLLAFGLFTAPEDG